MASSLGVPDDNATTDEPVRTYFVAPTSSLTEILTRPYDGDPDEITAKTFVLCAIVEEWRSDHIKSGLVSSNDPLVRIVESGVSYTTPGDLARVRSPGRSTVYRAATPGGGGGAMRIGGGGGLGSAIGRGAEQIMRCPTGYQYGGRFSNRLLNNCGQQLFDVPGAEAPGSRAVQQAVRVTRTIGVVPKRTAGRTAQLIEAGRIGSAQGPKISATLTRMANVPHVGAASPRKVEAAVTSAITAAGAARGDFVRLIRRDGVALDARVNVERLASQVRNVDMAGGTIVAKIGSPKQVGFNEVGLFRAGVSSVRLVAPGGHEFRLDYVGNPKGELSQIGRTWGTIRRAPNTEEGAGAIQRLVEASKGKLQYSEVFNNIDRPNELVQIARNDEKRTVPRWVYLAYYADAAPGRMDSAQGWKEIATVAQAPDAAANDAVTSLAAARKAVQDGEPLDRVPGRFLDAALKKSPTVDNIDLGGGRTLITRKNGEQYVRIERSGTAALSEKMLADFQRGMGIDAPLTRLAGDGTSTQAVVSQAATAAVEDGKLAADRGLTDVPTADLLRTSLVDFMFGVSDRNPAGLAIVQDGHSLTVVPSPGSGTVPKDAKAIAAVIRDPEKVFSNPQKNGWVRAFTETPDRNVRKSIAIMYDTLLKDASEFDWDNYVTRLGLDGGLSDVEKRHLEIMRDLVKSQVDQLRNSKTTLLRIIGAMEQS
jgi:hypothetical protein